jgi:RNase P protein component
VERHRSKRLLRHEADEVEDRLAHFDLVRPPVSLLHLEHAGLMLVRT